MFIQLAENTGVIDTSVLKEFMKSTWLPEVIKIHHPTSGVLADYFLGLLSKIQHLEVHEVFIIMKNLNLGQKCKIA